MRWRIDRLIEPSRHAFELSLPLDGQRLAVDLAFDHGHALQLDAIAANNALASAA
jgi:hypothetical protein